MAMNTEDSLREYLRLFVQRPAASARIGPLARTFDFVADAAPGVKEILAVGKLCLRGARAPLRPGRRRRRGERPHRRPDRRAAGDPRAGPGRAGARPDASGCSTSSTDPARTGVVIVTTPEEMPVTETIELLDRAASRDRRRRRRRRRQPGAAGAVRPRRGGRCSTALEQAAERACSSRRPGAGVRPVLDAAQLAEARRRNGAGHLATPARRARRRAADAARARAVHRARRCGARSSPRRWPTSSSAGLADGSATAATPRTRRRARAAARGQGDGARVRVGRRRQDDDRRGARRAGGDRSTAARCSCSPSTRPAGSPTRSASGRSATRGAACRPRRSRRPASSRAASCGWRCSTPRPAGTSSIRRHAPERRGRDAVLANPLYQNITGRFVHSHDYIAMEQLHELHASGHYDLVIVDTPPSRNALDVLDAPGADGGVLRQPTAALADRALPVAAVHRRLEAVLPSRRPGARLAVPAGHRRVLHPVPGDGAGLRRPRPRGRAGARRPADDVRRRVDARGGALARGVVPGAGVARPATCTSGRSSPTASYRRASPRRRRPRVPASWPRSTIRRSARVAATLDADPEVVGEVLRDVATQFHDTAMVATRESERRAELAASAPMLVAIPLLAGDVNDVADLLEIAEHFDT